MPVLLGLFSLALEGLVQCDDLKVSLGKSLIDRFVDFGIGAAQVEPSDPNIFGQRFGGNGSSVSCGKPTLQEIHPLYHLIHVFGNRTNGIQMVWLNRQHAFQGNKPESRLQTDDAATSRGNADGARRLRSQG